MKTNGSEAVSRCSRRSPCWATLVGMTVSLLMWVGLPAQAQTTLEILSRYDVHEDVVVKVSFTDVSVARKISITYEPRESNYEAGYLVLQEQRGEIERLLKLSEKLGISVEVDLDATLIEQQISRDGGTQKKSEGPLLPGSAPNNRDDPQKSTAIAFAGIPGFACYRTVEETFATAEQIALDHPDLATWTDVGDSWEKSVGPDGYDINVLRLTNQLIAGPKPAMFITSAIHAREYTTAELMTRFAEQLVADYGVNADTTWILDHTDIRLVLIANPDGRKQAETGLLWRKNTNEDYCGVTSNTRGADLNRNFSFEWGCCGGSSTNECSQTFRGAFAESEPETQAVIDQLSAIFPDARGPNLDDAAPLDTSGMYLDIHSSGRLILWPWGFTSNPAPNGTQLQTLGRKLAFFNGHTPQQSIGLYPTDGTTTSYGYGELGLPSFTYELGTEFFESCTYFENTLLPDNIPSLMYALKVVRAPYRLPAGPEGYNIGLLPRANTGVPAGTAVEVTVTFDDTRYNNSNGTEPAQNIVAAEYYIDVPPWESGASAFAMAAADSSFNSNIETVQASIDTTPLTEGRHTVYTRARDAAGNWGVVSAAFLDIDNNATLPMTLFEDDFENDRGWVSNPTGIDTATTGQWERANPQQTNSGGTLQLGTTVSGQFDLVTGPLAGSSAGTHDIDGGITSIRSPSILIPAGATDVELGFYAYLAHLNNATAADFLRVSVVGSASANVQVFEELGDPNRDNASWEQHTVNLSSFAGESVFLLVEAADAGGGSLIEAGIDDVSITAIAPAGGNAAPSVNAGVDQSITLPGAANLDGSVTDDGLPTPPGSVTTTWRVVSGPGSVTFGNVGVVDTRASFSAPGVYVLRLEASDSALSTSDDVQVTVQPAGGACPAGSIDFNQLTLEAYSNQDLSGGASAAVDGSALTLTGNAWKRSVQSFILTPNSVLEFDFASSSQGEIHGIGFDVDQTLNNDARMFRFWGTQNWAGGGAIDYSPKYSGDGGLQSFTIAVGSFYSGAGLRLVFVNDKDAGAANNTGTYRCVRVVEQAPLQCDFEETFSSGLGGWTNSPSSTCSTGTFVAGTPSEVVNGGVVTQVDGDHTSGSGAALFSAENTAAGTDDIDNGECIAESPNYEVTSDSELSIWYFHGQRDAGDDASGDYFDLALSLDGGVSWTSIASNGDQVSNAAWTEANAPIPADSSVKLRLRASDGAGSGDLIEAGLDDLRICSLP